MVYNEIVIMKGWPKPFQGEVLPYAQADVFFARERRLLPNRL
jgi:hypothetical protein